jgi:FeS assembly SUF system regulator
MLRLTKLADYGIVVMTYLAEEAEQVHAANDVAGATGLALPTVSKVLKALSRGGLVSSVRGARGGYRLTRSPRAISVAEVIHALEGPLAMTECTSADGACSQEERCAVRANWKRINETVHQALSQVSLEQMVLPRTPAAVVPVSDLTRPHGRPL